MALQEKPRNHGKIESVLAPINRRLLNGFKINMPPDVENYLLIILFNGVQT